MRQYFFILTLIFLTLKTYACDCIGESTIKESINNSDLVVVATVLSKDFIILLDSENINQFHPDTSLYKNLPYSIKVAKYKFVVDKIFKGKSSSDTVTIYTGLGGGDCGFNFKIGNKYIIYGQTKSYFGLYFNKFNLANGQDIYWTNICTRTTPYDELELKSIKNETAVK